MASLGKKNGIFHVRFRFQGIQFKKSLKIRERDDAEAARNLIEVTLHRLRTGQLLMPAGVDPGEFVASGGILPEARPETSPPPPSTRQLTADYRDSVRNLLAPSYLDSQVMHLRHFLKWLGKRAEASCDQIDYRDLDAYLKKRLAERHPNTVERERITLRQFYKWVAAQGHRDESPAARLAPIKGGVDRPPFRTIAEVLRIIERGGLDEASILDLWECLYLAPPEIAALLATVRANAVEEVSFLLHAIPAYTGMRRGEVLRLRWLDVDLDEGYLIARSRKQSRKRTETIRRIDLHPELRKELAAWRNRRSKGQYVLSEERTLEPLAKDRANRCFWQPMRGTEWCLDRRRDWYKVGFHTYRHSFASNLAALGVDQRIIDEWMGHQTEAMRKRYRHLFPGSKRSAIELLSLTSPAVSLDRKSTGPCGRTEK